MTLSLRTWLAVGLLLATAVPVAAGAGAWLAAGEWQRGREATRRNAAVDAVASASLETSAGRKALFDRLSRLGVEADLTDGMIKPVIGDGAKPGFADKAKQLALETALMTPGLSATLQSPNGKQQLNDQFSTAGVKAPQAGGTLFVHHESLAVRWAIALGVAAVALAAALALAVTFLNRWVLRPLARLASDADRIAGGELTATPAPTRAREVAQVGDALHGMAGALGSALGVSAAAERERRFLISAIAHDLRTPLFTLRGSLEAIEHGLGDRDALARAQRKAAHLDRLVGDLFAFSRSEYAEPALEPVDLAAVARRAVETVEPGSIRIAVDGEGASVLGDPVALQRVLTNLLENAVRHARSRVDVVVRTEAATASGAGAGGDAASRNGAGAGGDAASRHGTGVRGVVEVVDDGAGFAAEDLPHVFEPLFRGDKARQAGGAGLGLAIARRLARAHGGDVGAANAAGGGARVTVTLP